MFKYWDQENLWPELEGMLSEKFVKKGEYWVAPQQFADPSLNYDGYRAGIKRLTGVGNSFISLTARSKVTIDE